VYQNSFVLITLRLYLITRHVMFQEVDVPVPAILKPVPLWTGKQVFTCIIKPNRYTTSFVNFEMKVR
jgi:hypothetical protein